MTASSGRTIHSSGGHAGNAYRQGFFWPTNVSDTDPLVRRCEGSQFFAHEKHMSSHQLQTIPITWLFSTWGLDLVGWFKKAKGGFTHIFIAVDKFTKWIEVKPVASITAAKAVESIAPQCDTHRATIKWSAQIA
jgi:hypothetical protein